MTFDYSRVLKELLDTHMQLMNECYDYISNLRHECYMTVDLKHVYLTVKIYLDDWRFFAFIISRLGQLQLTRMQQKSKLVSFTMSKLMCKALREISENSDQNRSKESSLLQSLASDLPPSLTFYQDNILEEHVSFENQFVFLQDYFFSQIKWARLRLSFKKLYLFQTSIKVLKICHLIKKRVWILNDCIKKIINFSIFTNKTEMRAFFETINITHKWVSNFFEISRPLTRLTGKVDWK